MGLFGGLFGGGPDVYVPKHTKETEDMAYNAAQQSGAGGYGPIGVDQANTGYNYQPLQQAQQGYSKMPSISATYNPQNITAQYNSPYQASNYTPTNYNFQTLPDQYYQQAYGSGAGQIKQQGQSATQQASEAIGPRNIGAVNAATQGIARQTSQNLAGLSQNLGMERMQEGVQAGKEQQQAQEAANQFAANYGQGSQQFAAGETGKTYESQLAQQQANAQQQYQGYQSQLAQQTGQANSNLNYLQGLAATGAQQIGLQQTATGAANNQEIQRQQLLNSLFSSMMGGQNQAAGIQQQSDSAGMNFLGGLAGTAVGGLTGTASKK